jgi:hypothetical protein
MKKLLEVLLYSAVSWIIAEESVCGVWVALNKD